MIKTTSQELVTRIDINPVFVSDNHGHYLVDFVKIGLTRDAGESQALLDVEFKGYVATKDGVRSKRASTPHHVIVLDLAPFPASDLADIVVDMVGKTKGVTLKDIESISIAADLLLDVIKAGEVTK